MAAQRSAEAARANLETGAFSLQASWPEGRIIDHWAGAAADAVLEPSVAKALAHVCTGGLPLEVLAALDFLARDSRDDWSLVAKTPAHTQSCCRR